MSLVSQDNLNQQAPWGQKGGRFQQVMEVHPQDWEMTGHGGYEEDTGWAERQTFMQSRHRAVD